MQVHLSVSITAGYEQVIHYVYDVQVLQGF